MKYRLLIVDDEKIIRSGIRARLEYLKIEFEEVREASASREALEILEEWKCDIVITDIRMPDMDGLDFIEMARERWPHIKFVIVSGYTEFEYAERAIGLGVSAYLVKPLSNPSLKDVMTKLFAALQEEENVRRAARFQVKLESERIESLLEMEINCLLTENGHFEIGPEIYPTLFDRHSKMCRRENHYFVAVVSIDADSFEENKYKKEELELLRFSIKNVFNELNCWCEKLIVSNLSKREQLYALFGGTDVRRMRREIEKCFIELKSFFELKMGVNISVGVSNNANSLNDLNCREAQEALDQRIVYGRSNLYFYEDISSIREFQFPMSELTILRQNLERKDIGNVEIIIGEIFSEDRIEKYRTPYIRIMWMHMLNLLIHITSNNAQSGDVVRKIVDCFSIVEGEYKLEALKRQYISLVNECIGDKDTEENNAKNKIKMAVHYIEKHYNENISVNQLAEKFEMSPNYFSTMFKKEIGQSTVNYVTDQRISKAKEFLRKSDKSVVEIAQMIGYEDCNYFFRVFKKNVGVTPQQYRAQNDTKIKG